MKTITKGTVETRVKGYYVSSVDLRMTGEQPRLVSVVVTRGRWYSKSLTLTGGAAEIAHAVYWGQADAGMLGDYLEDHPSEVEGLDVVVLATARFVQRSGVKVM